MSILGLPDKTDNNSQIFTFSLDAYVPLTVVLRIVLCRTSLPSASPTIHMSNLLRLLKDIVRCGTS